MKPGALHRAFCVWVTCLDGMAKIAALITGDVAISCSRPGNQNTKSDCHGPVAEATKDQKVKSQN